MPRRKAESAPLSRERILDATLAVLDGEGLAAVSMRRVAQELGVEAMSLYHHVPSKAALLDGVFERVLAELPSPARRGAWPGALRTRARAFRAVLCAHPQALPLFATRPAVTPAALGRVEEVLQLLDDAGFSPLEAVRTLQVVTAFVVGHTAQSHGPRDAAVVPHYAGLDVADFPRVLAAASLLSEYDVEAEFEWGLTRLLRGLAGRPRFKRSARS